MATADSSYVLADGSEVKSKVAKKKAAPKKKRAANRPVTNENGERVTPVTGAPASDFWVAGDCQLCNSENTKVYDCKNGKHYIKCYRCGHTWARKKRVRKKANPKPTDEKGS